MTSQAGKQIIEIHIVPSISKRKSNPKMQFGQLIEYNMTNISHQKSCRKWGTDTSYRRVSIFLVASGKHLSFNIFR